MIKKLISLGIILLFIGSSITIVSAIEDELHIITVDDEGDGDFTSIQDAVDFAVSGSIIEVYSGTYEGDIEICDKSITLKGISYELGDGNDTGKPVINVIDNLENFRLVRIKHIERGGYIEATTGIIIDNSINCTIQGFKINGTSKNNSYGIFIFNCSNIIISNNIILNNSVGIADMGSNYDNLIKFFKEAEEFEEITFKTGNNSIINNNITNNDFGINIIAEKFSVIEKNNINNNSCGLFLCAEKNDRITNNLIVNNNNGIALEYCSSTEITNNIISDNNKNYPSDLMDIIDYFDLKKGGIISYISINTKIERNHIENNIYGIELKGSIHTIVKCNNIINNIEKDACFTSSPGTLWKQNYWTESSFFKLIHGKIKIGEILIPWIQIDWLPAKELYEINL